MDNFASYRYTLGKNLLGKQTLGNFTNGIVTMYKFTKSILPLVMVLPRMHFFNDYYYSEFNSDSCVKVL